MRSRLFIVAMLAPSCTLLVLFYAYPIFKNLSMSFTDLSLLGMSRGGNWVGLDNYREILRSGDFGHILFNTLIWLTATSVAIRLLHRPWHRRAAQFHRPETPAHANHRASCFALPWATPPIVAVVDLALAA